MPWRLAALLDQERDRWVLWVPVLVGGGAAAYYGLKAEPSAELVVSAAVLCLAACFVLVRRGHLVTALVIGSLVCGFAVAKAHADWGGTAIIHKRTSIVDLHGWIERAERKGGVQRAVLRVDHIADWELDDTPQKIRLNLYGAETVVVGTAINASVRLEPLPGPVEPGAFNFARRAWFEGIGGTAQIFGSPAKDVDIGPAPWNVRLTALIHGLRIGVADRISGIVEGQSSAFLVAVTTGARADLSSETVSELRAAGLAHLLAISGLHMALVGATMFGAVRAFLALFPSLALRFPIKKWSAVTALLMACAYLVLSGASVSTQRAFIMISIMFLAILVDRPAISIRNVALAAMAILLLRPQSIVDVSFQMSFITVTVLIGFYEWYGAWRSRVAYTAKATGTRFIVVARRLVFYFSGVVTTTVLAGLATGPVGTFHFHTFASYGVVGNLFAVPIMAMLVMPLALLSVLVMPFGGEQLVLPLAAWGTGVIIVVARWVAEFPGAVSVVGAIPFVSALMVVGGMLWLSLWQHAWRLLGVLLIAGGIASGGVRSEPAILVEREAKTMALRNADGELVLTNSRAGRFAAERWLSADGDAVTLSEAKQRAGLSCDQHGCFGVTIDGVAVAWITHASALWDACGRVDVVIARIPIGSGCDGPAILIDWWDVYNNGAHSIYWDEGELIVHTAREELGTRPWVPGAARPLPVEGSDNE